MRDAIVAVEDRRFRSHPGVDPIGIVRAARRALPGGALAPGRIDHHPAARPQHLPEQRPHLRPQDARGDPGAGARMALLQGPDPRTLSQPRLFRRRRLRHRRRLAPLLRPQRDRAQHRRGGDHRRPGQGAVQLFADRRRRGGARPRPGRARADGREWRDHPGRGRRRRSRRDPARPHHPAAEQHPLFHRLGAAPARHVDRRDRAPLDVWTTIDLNMQRAADAAINANAPRGAQGALVTLDRDGAVRAMVGGRDYVGSNYNRATQANRQPGSSFKLFVYLAALEAGYRPDTIVQDEPITIDGWTPRNDNGRHAGPIPLRIAFAYSINTVAVRLAQQVGTRAVADMAQRFGITTRIDTNPTMALGSSEVRLIDMTRAYASVGARRRRGDALRHPPGDDRRRHPALPAPGRRGARAGRALGRGADDRLAAGRRRARHRPRRRSSAGRPPARPAPPPRTRTAGSSAFRAGSPPACGWAATTIAPCPASPAAARRPRAFHDFMVRAVANRPVEQFATDATGPEWQVDEGENEILLAPPDDEPLVDADGNPIEPAPPPEDDRPRRGPTRRSARGGRARSPTRPGRATAAAATTAARSARARHLRRAEPRAER